MPHAIRSIGWALYAATSWTWCIGLYLPVILMQWFGWSGFLLIAIPNCIGAAAMGLFLGSPSASRRFCRRNATLIRNFEFITIGFHLVFLAIVGTWFFESSDLRILTWALPLGGLIVGLIVASVPKAWWPVLGMIVFAFGGLVVINNGPEWSAPGWMGTRPLTDLIWFSPIFIVGFLVCPWLDGPFHRARQETNGPLSSLVLGGAFLCMLFVTATYWWLDSGTATITVLVWLIGQSIFTIAANLREALWGIGSDGRKTSWLVGSVVALCIAYPSWFVGSVVALCIAYLWLAPNWDQAQDLYLRWLSLYGILFPALVLAWCRRNSPPPSSATIGRLIFLLVIAGVLAEVGCIWGPTYFATLAVIPVLMVPWFLVPWVLSTWPRSTS